MDRKGTFLVLRHTSKYTAYPDSRIQAGSVRAHTKEPGTNHYRPLIILLVTYLSKVKNADFISKLQKNNKLFGSCV